MSLSRNNAGPAELKIGGAIYGAASYKDAKLAKMTSAGGYIKFADDAKPATTTTTTTVKQGAAALTTYGALALATAYALF